MHPDSRLQTLRDRLLVDKVVTLELVCSSLNCSLRSAQRHTARWNCLHSYNHNGRYFTLPEVPQFNSAGIWLFRGIGFSRFGNLKATVVEIVRQSPAGLSVPELSKLLGSNAYSFMSLFRDDPRMVREKWDALLVYFAADPHTLSAQRVQRANAHHSPSPFPSDSQAVAILVEFIKHPETPLKELTSIVQGSHPRVDFGMIERLLLYHDLLKKT